jgi:FKBP-type peptidyl-prolyl cis-trans isomerase
MIIDMKLLIVAAAFFLLLPAFPVVAAESGPQQSLQALKDKESYSIGYQVGMGMKFEGVEVNFDRLQQGLRDGIDGKAPLLTPDEMKQLIIDLKKRAREIALSNLQKQIAENEKESERFLSENRNTKDVKTTESGLQYMVLKDGSGVVPGPADTVRVNYRGMFIDGTEFDRSPEKEPQTVQVDGVIKGWTEALRMMKVGSKWRIFVPPFLAYGRSGLGQKIPPNKVLVFEIELLSVEHTESDGKRM